MTSTVFVDQVTPIVASWLNDVNAGVYTTLPLKAAAGANTDITSLSALGSLNSGPLAGFRNRLRNGGMQIAQRGVSANDVNGYFVDGWYTSRTGSVNHMNVQVATGFFGINKFSLKISRTSGDTQTNALNLYQPIEQTISQSLAGGNATLSFILGTGANISSLTGHSVNVYYQTSLTDQGVGGTWTAIGAQAFSVTANTSYGARQGYTFAIPPNATQLMVQVSFNVTGTAGADESFYITEIQLEPGSVATPFERRPIGTELALCQRYFEKSYNQADAPGTAGYLTHGGVFGAVDVSSAIGNTQFSVPKRAIPTVTIYDPATGLSGHARDNSGGGASVPMTVADISQVGFNRLAGTLTAGHQFSAMWTANAEL
jgi:hypothetical protein